MKKRDKSIYQTILKSLIFALVLEVYILLAGIYLSHTVPQLNQNSMDILKKQVENRKGYLEAMMLDDQNLNSLSEQINNVLQQQIKEGITTLDGLGKTDESYLALMKEIIPNLISTLRQKKVTGVFAIFNTEDMDDWQDGTRVNAVYIRDLDPDATYSYRNSDLLIERSPVGLVQSMNISTDTSWKPYLTYQRDLVSDDFFAPVFQKAIKNDERLNADDYGRWTTTPYILEGEDTSHEAIAYTIPLISPDGDVYGVLGVDLLTSYLKSKLPTGELQNDGNGTYFLVSTTASLNDEEIPVCISAMSGDDSRLKELGNSAVLKRSEDGDYWIETGDAKYYSAVSPLTFYANNAPFSNEQWLLVGTVESENLFRFSNKMLGMLLLAVFLMFMVGILFSIIVSVRLARPIYIMSSEIAKAQKKRNAIPELSRTGIRELDQFSSAFTQLGRDVLESSTKFLRIMDMASVELAGYEIRMDLNTIYVTDNFFELLGMPEVDCSDLDVQGFRDIMDDFQKKHPGQMRDNVSRIYQITRSDGGVRYVRMEVTNEQYSQIGLLEEVTTVTLERMKIERERDYDSLTGIYRRQALRRECEKIFNLPEKIKCAAILMIDLDNLKQLNDNYGHDWGDRYIRHVAKCLEDYSSEKSFCGRRSGDEFIVFFYGFDSKDQIRKQIESMICKIKENELGLPNGKRWTIHASGGVAWYPDDGLSLDELEKYADFAMYKAKKNEKGSIREFDLDSYNQEKDLAESRKEFYEIINKDLVRYHFQPIVSAKTGEAEAYEALMRVSMLHLSNPERIMKMAREEGRLHDIERITMFKAPEAFINLKEQGLLRGNEKLFINSIASENLNEKELKEFFTRYEDMLNLVVVEITEEEALNMDALNIKKATMGKYVTFALDDYGTGYSNDKNLLDVSPRYIKIDRFIIQDIDKNHDKQELAASIISYAHARNMYIIAEGMERREELIKVLELGVDYLQGFYLAYPKAEPEKINPEAFEIIKNYNEL